ncbi:type II secretion system protein M [Shewanella dokdonensis]|uniref:Type II secretion system protein M n=1 Tax=Shewanella dokdonensis TaxID=712036 RepID=A0ABX8DHZ1_9GAMM|nr:type II secretion system protein M [Shewanella dokdonensis]MCL1076226.1 type II secretion system protein M [Shewanella dokdonensis]QVK24398.1 type II secretion system protein M [Shewanella dokdonensis]
MENLQKWWASLAQRERQLVLVMAGIVLMAIFYWGLWTPLSNAEAQAQVKLNAQQQTLLFVKQSAAKITALKKAGTRPTQHGSLSTLVTQSAAAYGLSITRMQPQGKQIQLWMDDVPFDALLSYLGELVQKQGLSLDSLDVAEGEQPGMVKVRRIQLSQS